MFPARPRPALQGFLEPSKFRPPGSAGRVLRYVGILQRSCQTPTGCRCAATPGAGRESQRLAEDHRLLWPPLEAVNMDSGRDQVVRLGAGDHHLVATRGLPPYGNRVCASSRRDATLQHGGDRLVVPLLLKLPQPYCQGHESIVRALALGLDPLAVRPDRPRRPPRPVDARINLPWPEHHAADHPVRLLRRFGVAASVSPFAAMTPTPVSRARRDPCR